jgi:hypothetical protein
MFDSGKVIIGLFVFLAIASFPLWYNRATGEATAVPELVYPVGYTECVADSAFMRSNHMDLLNQWRDEVVRHGRRIYTSPDGTRYVMSLQNTCMGCHSNKATFCDRCHTYMAVSPYCWQCHVEPKESL